MSVMLSIRGLVKQFGPFTAVNGIGCEIRKGEVLGFLGPNGAGKSTTMKMITGHLGPTAGSIEVCGIDALASPIAAKQKIGYLPEGAPAYPDMTPAAFLNFIADIRDLKGAEKRNRIDQIVDRVELKRVLHQPIDTLSKGFKRRVGLAQALLHDPEVLVLDEPTDGLDPNQKHQVRELIREIAPEKAILISTHILEEVSAVCSRAMIIAHGEVVVDGTPGELLARSRYCNAVVARIDGGTDQAMQDDLQKIPGVAGIETEDDGRIVLFPAPGSHIADGVTGLAKARGWNMTEFYIDPGRMDDVFRSVTRTAS